MDTNHPYMNQNVQHGEVLNNLNRIPGYQGCTVVNSNTIFKAFGTKDACYRFLRYDCNLMIPDKTYVN